MNADARARHLLKGDRFTWILMAVGGLVLAAAFATAWVAAPRPVDAAPPYQAADTPEAFVFNAYVAHFYGDLERLQTIYAAEVWAEMESWEKDWGGIANGSYVRILDAETGADGLQVRVARYDPDISPFLNIRRLEMQHLLVTLAEEGDSWQLTAPLSFSRY